MAMTISCFLRHTLAMHRWLLGIAVALLPFGNAFAWQSTRQPPVPVVIAPPPAVQFQQTVQQQQVRDQLQKSQLQQQLHQGVTDNAKRPTTRELSHEASAIGAAIDANTSPMKRPSPNASKTICWTEEM